MIGLGLSIVQLAVRQLLGFSPLSLFAAGEQGAWYDPSDMSTLFQNSAGTTPVTAVEQPVGSMLDKSGRGNHATQSTSASRPVLSARVNLLTKTEQFDDVAWLKSGSSVAANTEVAPDGTLTADTLTATAATPYASFRQTGSPAAGTYTFSLSVKKGISFSLLSDDAAANGIGAVFDGATGAKIGNAVLGSGWTLVSSSCATHPVNSNYWLASITVIRPTATATYANTVVLNKNKSLTYAGSTSIGDSLVVWGADLRVANDGVGLPAYQRVNTSTDYDTTGFPMYLRFDGVDDGMVTNSINFTSTDKMTVFAGVRKLSDTARGALAELAAGGAYGVFALFTPSSASPSYSFESRGLAYGVATVSAGYTAPITNNLTGIGNISGDSAILRINGTQAASSTADQGTGNFGNYPLYIGRRGGTTLPLNGRLYSLIVRGAQSTADQIAATETYVNSKTKAY